MYEIQNHPLVEKDLKDLDHSLIILVFKKLKQLQQSPQQGELLGNKNNMNLAGYRKVYVAKKKIRIVYQILDNKLVVHVITVGKRADLKVYKEAFERINKSNC